MIDSLSQRELQELALQMLVQRMDDILRHSLRERYGTGIAYERFPVCLVSDIVNTQKVAALSDEEKRKIAHISFSYLVQLELISVASGFTNAILYTPEYDEKVSWLSPLFRLRDGAIRQYQIVSSRMAMEIFMDLLYYIETGHRLESKRSKLKAFRKWLCDSTNQFHYFAHVLLEAYRFDRSLRTPEVHGTPKLPQRLLLLQLPSHEELNEPHHLSNSLLNCWRPLLDLLNGQRPSYMQISESEESWFMTYMSGSENDITDQLAAMFDSIE
jgi:hypothetical protein